MKRQRTSAGQHAVRALAVFGAGALVLHAWRLQMKLFGRTLSFRLDRGGLRRPDQQDFAEFVAAISDAPIHRDTHVSVLTNGDHFYPAQLEAIAAARSTINLETYEFLKSEISDRFVQALSERARAGVEVRLVIDALGSFGTNRSYFELLERAGGRVAYYHPVNSRDWPYLNTRTHRKLLVVDGATAFVGGAGIADQWAKATPSGGPRWRDTMLKIEGRAACAVNSVFVQNWIACTGEVLAGSDDFPLTSGGGKTEALVVTSSPGGAATKARILYQTLIEAAARTIDITTPYFVPGRSARSALIRAARDRGVRVRILTAGPHSDHRTTQRLGRSLAAKLIEAGAEVYEYQPSMIHAKVMTVDGIWAVTGSTNFDHRSFELNDEVNAAFFDRELAARLEWDFENDLAASIRLTPRRLRNEPFSARALGDLSWLVRREE
jgi:cardiolipin synthase